MRDGLAYAGNASWMDDGYVVRVFVDTAKSDINNGYGGWLYLMSLPIPKG